MSLHDYHISQRIEREGYPFYALIMAAMRQADSNNLFKLQAGFPEVWDELQRRYVASNEFLPVSIPIKGISYEGAEHDTIISEGDTILFQTPAGEFIGTVGEGGSLRNIKRANP